MKCSLEDSDVWSLRLHFDSGKDFTGMSEKEFEGSFYWFPASYDLHDKSFQDWALAALPRGTNGEIDGPAWRGYSTDAQHWKKRMLRAAVYAICSREDLDWQGRPIDSVEERAAKRQQLEARYRRCRLFEWARDADAPESAVEVAAPVTHVEVWETDTQATTERLVRDEEDGEGGSVAWLNMANAYNCCGTYNTDFGGSQEEEVAPNSTACAILGLNATAVRGLRSLFERGQPHIRYRDGCSIPIGGCYVVPAFFVTSQPQIESTCIAAAFADFRPRLPIFTPHAESPEFFSWFGFGSQLTVSENVLEERLLRDIMAVLLTAAHEGIQVLVLGAR